MTEMTGVNPFQFEGRNVRLIEQDGEMWFVATDVARELGYDHTPHLVRSLDDDERGVHTMDTLGGSQEVAIISEPGLYRAIVQRRTNKKHDASLTARIERFQRWVFHDVLPSIRKTGGYGAAPVDPMKLLNDPVSLRGLLTSYTEKVIALESHVATLVPKAEALDRLAMAQGSLCITDAAKALQIRPKSLFTFMRAHGWIYRRTGGGDLGYQDKITAGWLIHKVTTYERDGIKTMVEQVRVTPKGLAALAKKFPFAVLQE